MQHVSWYGLQNQTHAAVHRLPTHDTGEEFACASILSSEACCDAVHGQTETTRATRLFEALTKTIAEFAKSKQLKRAISAFEEFEPFGGSPIATYGDVESL